MGFGISNVTNTIANTFFRPALLEWVDPDKQEALETTQKATSGDTSLLAAGVNYLMTYLATETIKPDVKKSEIHKFSSNVTENVMEDGSIVSEHIIQSPIRLTLSFEETNGSKILGNVFEATGLKKSNFDKLVDVWQRKIICKVTTEHKEYDNMVIENMPIVHRSPYKGAYQVMIDLKQIKNRSLLNTYKAKEKGTEKSSSPTVEGGSQQTQDATNLPE